MTTTAPVWDQELRSPWNCADAISRLMHPAVKAANFVDRVLRRLEIDARGLDARQIIEQARLDTGLSDFGEDFDPGHLTYLIESLRAEAKLSLTGRIAARSDLLNLLVKRLRITEEFRRDRSIAWEEIRAPIFITGMPRTGTTLVHRLLAQDPGHRAPLIWEIMHPSPPPAYDRESAAARIRRTRQQLCWFRMLARGIDQIHSLDALEPEECIAITAHTFASARFHATYWMPDYEYWLRGVDMRPSYAFHKRFLQHLQVRCPPRRWILKSPAHLECLDALHDVYPDAIVVQTHRDPQTVLGSVASLTATLQSAFRDRNAVSPCEIGRQALSRWRHAVARSLSARRRLEREGMSFIDVQYEDLLESPVGTMEGVYKRIGLDFTASIEERMEIYLARHPKDEHGSHTYDAQCFGIDAGEVAESFAEYRAAFEWKSRPRAVAREPVLA